MCINAENIKPVNPVEKAFTKVASLKCNGGKNYFKLLARVRDKQWLPVFIIKIDSVSIRDLNHT